MTGPTDQPPGPLIPTAGTVSRLEVLRREAPGQVELVLHGELDITTCASAHRAVGAVLREGPALVVLNLAELSYLDSSGVRLVLLAQQDAAESGHNVTVRLGSGLARRLFDVLGLTERFDVLDGHLGIDTDTDTDTDTGDRSDDGGAGDRGRGGSS